MVSLADLSWTRALSNDLSEDHKLVVTEFSDQIDRMLQDYEEPRSGPRITRHGNHSRRSSPMSAESALEYTNKALATFTIILNDTKLQQSPKSRVLLMGIISSLIGQTNNLDFLNLADSPIGQWCLRSLQSSLRELRIAAA